MQTNRILRDNGPFGRTSSLGAQHRLCEWQPKQPSRFNLVENNRCTQNRMGCNLSRSMHQEAMIWQRTSRTHDHIWARGSFLALKSFLKNQAYKAVCLRTAKTCVNNKGGNRLSCILTLTLELCKWCLGRNIMTYAQHLPSKLNTIVEHNQGCSTTTANFPLLKGCEIDLFAFSPICPANILTERSCTLMHRQLTGRPSRVTTFHPWICFHLH